MKLNSLLLAQPLALEWRMSMPRTSRTFRPKLQHFSQFRVYLNVTQTKQATSLLPLNNFSPVRKERKATNYCVRFGHSLWSAQSVSIRFFAETWEQFYRGWMLLEGREASIARLSSLSDIKGRKKKKRRKEPKAMLYLEQWKSEGERMAFV